jgi:hypothetical protein
MTTSRRDFLKLGAGVVAGAMVLKIAPVRARPAVRGDTSGFYSRALKEVMGGNIDLTTNQPLVSLIDDAYRFDPGHEFRDLEGFLVGEPVGLTTITVTGGVLDADDITFQAVTGMPVGGLLIWERRRFRRHLPICFRQSLIERPDTAPAPLTPNGGDISIQWSSGGIFSL